MMRSQSNDHTVAATTETLIDIITGRTGITRRIHEIWFEQATGMVLRGYVDQDRLVDVGSESEQADFQAVPVDRLLADGETFSVGFNNETGGSLTNRVTVFYEESTP